LFGKWLALSPAAITEGRTVFATLALLAATQWLGTPLAICSRRDAARLLLSGVLLAAHWFSFFRSIQVSTVAVGVLSCSCFPLFVALLEPLCFRERLRGLDLALAGGVAAGLMIIPGEFRFDDRATQGVLWGVLSGFLFALLSLLNRSLARVYPPLMLALYQNAGAALCLLPAALRSNDHYSPRVLVLLLILGVVFTALAHALFIASLRRIQARLASIIVSLEPIYGAALAFLFLGEVPAFRTLAGGAIILGCVFAAMLVHARRSAAGRPELSALQP
jgi:drug/metabolite transporter (DMT)-like permease